MCVAHVLDALSARPTGCFAGSPVQYVKDQGEILEVTSAFTFDIHDGWCSQVGHCPLGCDLVA